MQPGSYTVKYKTITITTPITRRLKVFQYKQNLFSGLYYNNYSNYQETEREMFLNHFAQNPEITITTPITRRLKAPHKFNKVSYYQTLQ